MAPKISVIIPIYNVEKYLRRCLDSVQNQTFDDWQAICVDDGSPDNSGAIAEDYAKKDNRFIVVHKENGGLSDARNAGFEHSTGEYIMYLDSDDFIHPQTMEIAYKYITENGSEMCSFTYDRFYRPWLRIRHILHLDINKVMPFGIKRKYRIDKISALTTNDIFEYATERTHNAKNKNKRWLVKHCQVWKNLYRRDLIQDIPFIKGILFEDFPWWSEVLLKNPRTTIINLPLYYYFPNFGGILLSEKQLRIMKSLCIGLKAAYIRYKQNAEAEQMKKWQSEFMWFFVNWAFRKIKYLKTNDEIKSAKKEFMEMNTLGLFDDVPNEWYELRENIYNFIKG